MAVADSGSTQARVAPPAAALPAGPRRPVVHAIRIKTPPVIDGGLQDPVWQEAVFVSTFLQKQPSYGQTPSRRTDVALAYDDSALYVGARMHAGGRDDVQAVMTRRDESGNAERIIVSLDTFHDRRTAYSFAVTAAGVRVDWFHPDDSEFSRDYSFNPVWDAQVHRDSGGWTAEMRIPFTQLRFHADGQPWGININRYMPQNNEDIFLVPVPTNQNGWSSYFAPLTGISGIKEPSRIEIQPFITSDFTHLHRDLIDPADPFARSTELSANAGVDFKIGLGSSLTLDATINPDFSQVEADPAEVNLTALETFFTEKRLFFTEGSEILDGKAGLFYSRRIGARPRGNVRDEIENATIYVDKPLRVPIVAAGKLTGRLPSSVSVGALAAVTPTVYADRRIDYYDPEADVSLRRDERVPVEPLTGYGVARVQKELQGGNARLAASGTWVRRDLGRCDATINNLACQLADQAISAGLDGHLRFLDNSYELYGGSAFTHVAGEPEAIEAIAKSPVHYFQRPDQDHVSWDPTRDTMTGARSWMELGKRSGLLRGSMGGGMETPEFEPNDVGRLTTADDAWAYGWLGYQDENAGTVLQRWDMNIEAAREWNFGGAADPALLNAFGSATFTNFWWMSGWVQMQTRGLSDRATRGGPLAGMPRGANFTFSAGSPGAARTSVSQSTVLSTNELGGRSVSVRGDIAIGPVDWLRIILSPRYRYLRDPRQYVDTETPVEGGNEATFGTNYLFATLTYREIALQGRLQVSFTPNLTVDVYAEPFAASGSYRDYGILAAPRSRDLIETADRMTDDFTYLSLRSTAVLRWEFLPGSTLFVVWQQDRSESLEESRDVDLVGLGDAAQAPGLNVFAIKLSHYWPLG